MLSGWNHARLAKTFESTPSLHLTSYKGQVRQLPDPLQRRGCGLQNLMCVDGRTAWCMQVVEVGRKQGLGQWKVHRHEEDLLDVFPRESIVYLSPDATDVLEVRQEGAAVRGRSTRQWP